MLKLPTHTHCRSLTSLFQGRTAPLAGRGQVRMLLAGESVYGMGDPTDHLYYVIDGRIRTGILAPDGKEYVMKLAGPGELVGEFCFCSTRRRQEQAAAVTDARVARLDLSHLIGLVSSSKTEAKALIEAYCQRIGDLQNQVAELTFASLRNRLGFLLLRLSEDSPASPDGRQPCPETLTHEELAARISTTREQVSTLLSQYRKDGFIDYRRGSPILVDVRRLAEHLQNSA